MVLSKENEAKIMTNYSSIVEQLSLHKILDELISKNVISLDDQERIMSNSNPTQSDKNREFIKILIRGPEKGFNEFIEALRKDSGYVELADQIEKTEVDIQEPTLESWIGVDKITSEKKNTVLSDRNLLFFSHAINPSNLSEVATFLDISQNDVACIRWDNHHDAKSSSYHLLMKWKNKNGSSATLGNLLEKLFDASQATPEYIYKQGVRKAWDKL